MTIPVKHEGELWIPAPPEVSIRSIDLKDSTFNRLRADVKLEIDSASSVALLLDQLDYALSLGGREIASASVEGDREIPADGSVTLDLPIDVNPLSLGTAAATAFSKGVVDLRLQGGLGLKTPLAPWSWPVDVSSRAPVTR
ncbi:MAG: LEA type 2 family protein [Myxococcales bacterium]|nr:LEA type 2 family protein [Myxococcales bacterium]